MSELILPSLEIRNFRGFRHLQIERLGRVNLIVGKNNIGKSSLLEALRLYMRRGHPSLIWEILEFRDESDTRYRRFPSASEDVDEELLLSALKNLFYGRGDIRPGVEAVSIGPLNLLDKTLIVGLGWYSLRLDVEGNRKMQLLSPEEYDSADNPSLRFVVQVGQLPQVSYLLRPSAANRLSSTEIREINGTFIGSSGLTRALLARLWDNTTLSPFEEDILAAVHIVAPGVTGISIVGEDGTTARGRTPIVRVSGIEGRLPLRSLGEGMQRIFGIALALVNAEDGILLVDEIENGLHYSVQSDMWRLIFQLAHRLNIQVFATTHSWDCIEAFQEAALEDQHEEALLIRLDEKDDGIGTTLIDEKTLDAVVRTKTEVR